MSVTMRPTSERCAGSSNGASPLATPAPRDPFASASKGGLGVVQAGEVPDAPMARL